MYDIIGWLVVEQLVNEQEEMMMYDFIGNVPPPSSPARAALPTTLPVAPNVSRCILSCRSASSSLLRSSTRVPVPMSPRAGAWRSRRTRWLHTAMQRPTLQHSPVFIDNYNDDQR